MSGRILRFAAPGENKGDLMRMLPIQDVYRRKFDRQREIEGLEYHASGHCVHVGKLSPGCVSCFVQDPHKMNVCTGAFCNLDCPYCFEKLEKELERPFHLANRAAYLKGSREPGFNPRAMSFSGGGEPLLYIDEIIRYMCFYRDIEREKGVKPWYLVYTNGVKATEANLRRLADAGLDEIRFHLGATNFSRKVVRRMQKAVGIFKAVTVETPAWPPHRKKLFEVLPILHDSGVRHLNLGEIEVTKHNISRITEILPDAEIYQCHVVHLYDGGLVYDVMEEVIRKGYAFSALDCSCFVKSIQRSPGKYVCHDKVEDLVAHYG